MRRRAVLASFIASLNFGAMTIAMAIVVPSVVASLVSPHAAHAAGTENTFFETTGYFIALGTVLGASTLPFYEQPGSNLMNLAYGAGIGAVTGLGFAIFGGSGKTSREGRDEAQARHPDHLMTMTDVRGESYSPGSSPMRTTGNLQQPALISMASVHPVRLWIPLVSLTW